MEKLICNRLVMVGVLLLHGIALVIVLTAPAPDTRISARSRSAVTRVWVQIGAMKAQRGPAMEQNGRGQSLARPSPERSRPSDSERPTATTSAKLADDDYFWPEQLVSHPYPQEDVSIDDSCFKEGSSVLKIWINAAGKVDRIDIVSSTLTAQCVAIATRAFSQAHFIPGVKEGGIAVNSLWFVEIAGTTPPPSSVPVDVPHQLTNSRPRKIGLVDER